ncbi:MAG: PqqD family protein [Brevundimonas sp.]|uniref:PqqD family protein n=1 Tax=Brevundimonas sp. TaxID=1871086 RepID=UPI002AB9C5EC|nr:PqqD family protein [Brevundimonas sp.]MDZ4110369.1 PqqD family protein [Brevundimonas sp.]
MSATALAPTTKLQRNNGAISAEVDGETVMVDLDMGSYFALTGTGSFIWALLENPASLDEIVEAIRQEFDVSESGSLEDAVSPFIMDLFARGLVKEAI